MLTNLFKGVLIGLIIGMPLGPIGALCLKNTLTFGRKYGLISGLGSAFTDSIYAYLAIMGFMLIKRFIVLHGAYFRILGGLILICFGAYPFVHKEQNNALNKNIKEINKKSTPLDNNLLFKTFTSTFLISLANPTTIFSSIVIFTGMHLSNLKINPMNKSFLILGVFTGSMIWWFIFVFTAGKFTTKLKMENKSLINRILNYAIILGGLIIFLSAFKLFSLRKLTLLNSRLLKIFFNIKFRIHFVTILKVLHNIN
ncbi:LysE family transporter [Clostridium sp. LBM24168]